MQSLPRGYSLLARLDDAVVMSCIHTPQEHAAVPNEKMLTTPITTRRLHIHLLLGLVVACVTMLTAPVIAFQDTTTEQAEQSESASEPRTITQRGLQSLKDKALGHYSKGEYSDALATYAEVLLFVPNDVIALYNSACVQAKLGHPSKAAKLLIVAVGAGFVDIERMMNDADLDSVRDQAEYEAILEMREDLRLAAADRLETYARQVLGKDVIIERNDELRIIYAVRLSTETFAQMKNRVEPQLRWQMKHLFDGPPNDYVLLMVPTAEQADAIIGSYRVAGFYSHDSKRLVTRDLGPSLQHELTHALHHGHMDRHGQQHPVWMQEGLASIFEMYTLEEGVAGGIRVKDNTRINIAVNLYKIRGLTKWKKFFSLSNHRFVNTRPRAMYAEARCILQYVSEQGKCVEWYRNYVRDYKEDATGRLAFEKTFGQDIKTIEKNFRLWLSTKTKVPEGVPEDKPALGLWVVDQNANDGVEIVGFHPGGASRRSGIAPREVITEMDGQPVFAVEELIQLVLKCRAGQTVTLKLRRGTRYHQVEIKVRPVRTPRGTEIVQAPGALV